ncbi:hypothetical protein [Candidatus Odyssella acanthamoebae]|nr:hypothetical protein [Candidatus Paracaedibacter acanthamoebae]
MVEKGERSAGKRERIKNIYSPDLIRGLELTRAIVCYLEIPALRPGIGGREGREGKIYR